ncbi:MAG: UDP-glucose/GDP-mannose dehydrogenase dimerization [Parcubacteria group bacterium GW2011_GWA2_47_10b]|uniref:UDP-glucose/GDP-mannose dehydrogenase dimerization n=2 Tax=Parcubacteria group TaxID=1794811 RepID=A0A0G1T3P4_9BACT|nr:MAG: UDP-glucose/GDP-mannose dehydrogenase dimerization [Parcubacteria group bacterium GW2011_GWA2_47_10b]KKU76414.1 MAG: UDP-glucose/GDP-mannose dehydrogenase dimerization [Candidatus Giovannonibacteria bacterium GW2011_GWB1_47_6b]KKU86384.1 MAG: UDP-glucose/GDP-mannose dehydrogenase dimerization [Parcubacteria group bacterium GW2011_GWA1_47_9]
MNNSQKMSVGIIGIGMVGRELARYFQEMRGYERGKDLYLYDIDPKKSYSDDVMKGEVIFVCVPTPRSHDGSCNTTAVESVVASFKEPRIVVIKSTVPPGTTEELQKKHPQHKLLFNPEFLTESQAWHDMVRPDRQIVGFTALSKDAAGPVLSLLPHAPFMSPWGSGYQRHQLSATEAEIAKNYGNAFFSVKVIFANIIASSCEALGKKQGENSIEDPVVNYENVRMALAADYRIGASHLNVYHDGYRGFGGYCLPKDLDSLITFLDSLGVDSSLLKSARTYNHALLVSQGLTQDRVSSHGFNHDNGSSTDPVEKG